LGTLPFSFCPSLFKDLKKNGSKIGKKSLKLSEASQWQEQLRKTVNKKLINTRRAQAKFHSRLRNNLNGYFIQIEAPTDLVVKEFCVPFFFSFV
jgi:hypothetical protein